MDDKTKLARRKFVGGSDAAAILGLSPWKSPMDVFLEKTGMADDKENPDRQFLLDLGNDLEPVIAKLYERETHKGLAVLSPKTVIHPRYPFIAGSPDRTVVHEKRGVELKSENKFMDNFGEPGTDQVPYHYLIQCAIYMSVLDYPVWDVALLHGGASFAIYTIQRDMELERELIDRIRAWWDWHIVGKRPPTVDGSDAWKTYLRKKYPVNLLPIKQGDAGTLMLVRALDTIRANMDHHEKYQTEIENRLKLIIGEHDGIEGEFGRITWKKSKDGTTTDWESAFHELHHMIALPVDDDLQTLDILATEVIEKHTQPKPGSRRFLFTPRKGWTHGEQRVEQDAIRQTARGELPGDAGTVQDGDRQSLTKTSER